jgi:hypothetical protein
MLNSNIKPKRIKYIQRTYKRARRADSIEIGANKRQQTKQAADAKPLSAFRHRCAMADRSANCRFDGSVGVH